VETGFYTHAYDKGKTLLQEIPTRTADGRRFTSD